MTQINVQLHADIADREAVEALVEDAAMHLGRIDICVSNVSFAQRDSFLEMDWPTAQRTFGAPPY